jgi:hypothetical protein
MLTLQVPPRRPSSNRGAHRVFKRPSRLPRRRQVLGPASLTLQQVQCGGLLARYRQVSPPRALWLFFVGFLSAPYGCDCRRLSTTIGTRTRITLSARVGFRAPGIAWSKCPACTCMRLTRLSALVPSFVKIKSARRPRSVALGLPQVLRSDSKVRPLVDQKGPGHRKYTNNRAWTRA